MAEVTGEAGGNEVNGGMDSDQKNKQKHYIYYYKRNSNSKYYSCTIVVSNRIDKYGG